MSELTHGGERAAPLPDADPVIQAHYGGDLSTEDLSRRILMGMQQDIEAQIDWRLRTSAPGKSRALEPYEIGVILGTIGIGVPLTAIAAASAGLAGIAVIWLALLLINVAWAARR